MAPFRDPAGTVGPGRGLGAVKAPKPEAPLVAEASIDMQYVGVTS